MQPKNMTQFMNIKGTELFRFDRPQAKTLGQCTNTKRLEGSRRVKVRCTEQLRSERQAELGLCNGCIALLQRQEARKSKEVAEAKAEGRKIDEGFRRAKSLERACQEAARLREKNLQRAQKKARQREVSKAAFEAGEKDVKEETEAVLSALPKDPGPSEKEVAEKHLAEWGWETYKKLAEQEDGMIAEVEGGVQALAIGREGEGSGRGAMQQ